MNTPFLNKIYEQVDFDRDLVFKFFTIFSLFEYALKRAGFCTVRRGDEVQPDWESFAKAIDSSFEPFATPDLQEAVTYMLNYPVMKQVYLDGRLTFIQRHPPRNASNTLWLSILIRGVRNNLFHGGKFKYDRPRDPRLIVAALVILESWALLHPGVESELKYAH